MAAGKYWRVARRFAEKQKTVALGLTLPRAVASLRAAWQCWNRGRSWIGQTGGQGRTSIWRWRAMAWWAGGGLLERFGPASFPWALAALASLDLSVVWSARVHGFRPGHRVGAARGPMSIRRDEVKIGRARGCPAQSQRRHRVYPGHRCCPAPTKTACARMSAGCSAWALSRSFTCCVLRLPVQM